MEEFQLALGGGLVGVRELDQRFEEDGFARAGGVEAIAAREAIAGNLQRFERQFAHRAVAEWKFQRVLRHAVAQGVALGQREVLDQIPGRIEAGLIVEQADPERRQRAQAIPRPAVGAAHFQILFQAHFGKGRGHVVGPVLERRLDARQFGQFAGEELAEGFSGEVDVLAVPIAEIHRHVEQVIDVALETETIREDEIEHAGAVRHRCRSRYASGRRGIRSAGLR